MTKYQYLKIAVVALLLMNSEAVYAESDTVSEVVVRGNRRIDSAAILNAVSSKAGERLDSDRTDADIRSIFNRGPVP